MKLTELWTPEQCREAMELLGGAIELRGADCLVLDGDTGIAIADAGGDMLQVDLDVCMDIPCILQVAAEQTVNAANVRYYCAHGEMHNGPPYAVERPEAEEGNTPFGIATLTEEGKWARHGKPALFQTKLAALLAALRAVVTKETSDG